MKYQAYIINNASGEGRWSEHEVEDQYAENAKYLWSDGNFACDCNRALLWARAAGESAPDMECGEDAFSVPFIEWEDGRREFIDSDSEG